VWLARTNPFKVPVHFAERVEIPEPLGHPAPGMILVTDIPGLRSPVSKTFREDASNRPIGLNVGIYVPVSRIQI
jgi:hypothetical protein